MMLVLRGHSHNDGSRRDVLRNNGICADNGTLTDSYAKEQNSPCPNHGSVLDNRAGDVIPKSLVADCVIVRGEDAGANESIITDNPISGDMGEIHDLHAVANSCVVIKGYISTDETTRSDVTLLANGRAVTDL
ncbi:MAG: hypothetical protein ABI222_03210 [Opitutaceae bacterium]